MKLYHGSTDIVEKPQIIVSDKFLDFGFGFYTTTNKEQALRWAEIKRKESKAKTRISMAGLTFVEAKVVE